MGGFRVVVDEEALRFSFEESPVLSIEARGLIGVGVRELASGSSLLEACLALLGSRFTAKGPGPVDARKLLSGSWKLDGGLAVLEDVDPLEIPLLGGVVGGVVSGARRLISL